MNTGWIRPDEAALEAVYDLEDEDDLEMLAEVVEMFLDQGLPRLRRLCALSPDSEAGTIAELAHSLKSSFGNVGLPRAAEHCEQLVQRARAGDAKALRSLLVETAGLCDGLVQGLTDYLAGR